MIFARRGIDIDRYPSVKLYLENFRRVLNPNLLAGYPRVQTKTGRAEKKVVTLGTRYKTAPIIGRSSRNRRSFSKN